MALIGYARVSTKAQDLTIQLDQLKAAGCERIFHGKQSGAGDQNKAKLAELVAYVREGDVVMVTKLDRMGRSLKSVLDTVEQIHEKKATIKSLDGAVDTTNKSPMAQAQLSLLATFAQLERDMIVARTTEGREEAAKNNVVFGRPSKLTSVQQAEILEKLAAGVGVSTLASEYRVTRQAIYRLRDRDAAAIQK